MKSDYQLDASGNIVLVGLTVNETAELQLLDEMEAAIAAIVPPGGRDVGAPARRARWRQLYAKHVAARMRESGPPNGKMH